MAVRYPDISAYQKGMDYAALARQFPFVVFRCWRGNVGQPDTEWPVALRTIPRHQLIAYHYIGTSFSISHQVDGCLAHLRDLSIPIMLDWENGSGNVHHLRAVRAAFIDRGAHVPLLYAPRWYWQGQGRPDLSGLGALVNSHYHDPNNPAAWAPFGKVPVFALQYTDREQVQGRGIDMNLFRGSVEQFRATVFGAHLNEDDDSGAYAYRLPATGGAA